MIFKTIDFHVSTGYGEEPVALLRPFRLRINYIVDSFNLRIPKRIKTLQFHKLNVCVRNRRLQMRPFLALEGIGMAEFVDPSIASIYQAVQTEAAKGVKGFLRRGIKLAAKNDRLFAEHLDVWGRLLSTTENEFDYDCGVSRSHPSRRWRAIAVLRITPKGYHYDVLIKDAKSREAIQRHRIKTTECVLPFYRGIGFSNLRWEKEEIAGYTKDGKQVFRFQTGLTA
jgi:hypothetical protein